MALEISVIASADRLQAQRDRQAELQRELQREAARQQTVEAERLTAERRREEATAREIDRARFSREQLRDTADDRLFDDLQARDVVDDRSLNRLLQRQTDAEEAVADQRFSEAYYADATAVAGLAPLDQTGAANPAQVTDSQRDVLGQVIADRDARLAERAAEQRVFEARQSRDLERAERSIDDLRSNPATFGLPAERGEVVDVQA